MSDVVQPVTVNPLLAQDNLRFSRMVVDVVQGHGARYHVMYIATGKTLIVTTSYVSKDCDKFLAQID